MIIIIWNVLICDFFKIFTYEHRKNDSLTVWLEYIAIILPKMVFENSLWVNNSFSFISEVTSSSYSWNYHQFTKITPMTIIKITIRRVSNHINPPFGIRYSIVSWWNYYHSRTHRSRFDWIRIPSWFEFHLMKNKISSHFLLPGIVNCSLDSSEENSWHS